MMRCPWAEQEFGFRMGDLDEWDWGKGALGLHRFSGMVRRSRRDGWGRGRCLMLGLDLDSAVSAGSNARWF